MSTKTRGTDSARCCRAIRVAVFTVSAILAATLLQLQWAAHHSDRDLFPRIALTTILILGAIVVLVAILRRFRGNRRARAEDRLAVTCLTLAILPATVFVHDAGTGTTLAVVIVSAATLPWATLLLPDSTRGRVALWLAPIVVLFALLAAVEPTASSLAIGFSSSEGIINFDYYPFRDGSMVLAARHRRRVHADGDAIIELPDVERLEGIVVRFPGRARRIAIHHVHLRQRVAGLEWPLAAAVGSELTRVLRPGAAHTTIEPAGDAAIVVSNAELRPPWVLVPTDPGSLSAYPMVRSPFTARVVCLLSAVLLWTPLVYRTALAGAVAAAASRIRQTARRHPRTVGLAGNIVLIVLSMLVALTIAEAATRYLFRDVITTSTGGTDNFFHRRSYRRIFDEYNDAGYRGREVTRQSARDVYRVVVIGDSFAYGQSVYPHTLRFTEVAESMLDARSPGRVELVNLGVSGRNLDHHIKLLDHALILEPDFVLYQWFVNDVELNIPASLFFHPHLGGSGPLHEFLTRNSALYVVADYGWSSLMRERGQLESYTDSVVRRFADPQGTEATRAAGELERFLDALEQRGIPHGIVLFPHAVTPMDDYALGFLHDRVLATCQARGIECVDLRESYQEAFGDDYRRAWANPFDAHPSVEAHHLSAQRIVDVFADDWLGEPPMRPAAAE